MKIPKAKEFINYVNSLEKKIERQELFRTLDINSIKPCLDVTFKKKYADDFKIGIKEIMILIDEAIQLMIETKEEVDKKYAVEPKK